MRRDSIENRQRILDVFAQALQETPQDMPSMTDVVRLSGLGRGTVYRHFPQIGDLVYAYYESRFIGLFETYEPEWIEGDAAHVLAEFKAFMLRFHAFSVEHAPYLGTADYYASEGRQLAQTELRRKIFVTATKLSQKPLKPADLNKWADVIAHCVEVDHVKPTSPRERDPDLSVKIAMTLLKEVIG